MAWLLDRFLSWFKVSLVPGHKPSRHSGFFLAVLIATKRNRIAGTFSRNIFTAPVELS
jgi:hypothetical protein